MRAGRAALLLAGALPAAALAQGVGAEFRVNATTSGSQFGSAVARTGTGFVVVWTNDPAVASPTEIFGQRLDLTGAPLGGEFRVNAVTTGNSADASVAANKTDFLVTWTGPEGTSTEIQAQRFAATGGTLGAQFRVNSATAANQNLSSVASTSTHFTVAWFDQAIDGISGRRLDADGAPLDTDFRVDGSAATHNRPKVAHDSSGEFVVVYGSGSASPDGYDVFGQRFDANGAPLGSEFRVNEATTGVQSFPAVAHSGGSFVVVWSSINANTDVVGRRFDAAGAPLGGDFRVNSYTLSDQEKPSIAFDTLGNFAVVWNGAGPNDINGVWGRIYAASGQPLTDQFRVNQYTTSNQTDPAVVRASGAGTFLVTWSSVQEGASFEVYARFVCPKGDVNGSASIDVTDVFYLINYLFGTGAAPVGCSGDVNDDGAVDVLDVFYLINYLFAAGPAPV